MITQTGLGDTQNTQEENRIKQISLLFLNQFKCISSHMWLAWPPYWTVVFPLSSAAIPHGGDLAKATQEDLRQDSG